MADYDGITADLRHELKSNKESGLLAKKLVNVAELARKAGNVNVTDPSNPFMRFYYWIAGTPAAHMRKNFDRESTKLKTHISNLEDLKATSGSNVSNLESIISLAEKLHTALSKENADAETKLTDAGPVLKKLTAESAAFKSKIDSQETTKAEEKTAARAKADQLKMEQKTSGRKSFVYNNNARRRSIYEGKGHPRIISRQSFRFVYY